MLPLKPFPESHKGVQSFEHELLILFAWCPFNKCCILSHHNQVPIDWLCCMVWRRQWHPTPVLLPGESQGQGSWWTAVYGVAQSWTRQKRLSSSYMVGEWTQVCFSNITSILLNTMNQRFPQPHTQLPLIC